MSVNQVVFKIDIIIAMSSTAELDTEQLSEMAWVTNLNLRERLVDLKTNPPIDSVTSEKVRTEISTQMRLLDEYQSHLFLRSIVVRESPDDYFDQKQDRFELSQKLEKYYEWRIRELGRREDVGLKLSPNKTKLQTLKESDPIRFKKLFGELYKGGGSGEYINHWQKVTTYGERDNQVIISQHLHRDISFVDIIASYKKGFETSFYSGSDVIYGDRPLDKGVLSRDPQLQIRGRSADHPQPQVIIGKDGSTKFDF